MSINFSFYKYRWVISIPIISLLIVGVGCFSKVDVPEYDRRIQELNKVLMCPVCPGESIDQSQNPLASQMRDVVKEKINGGWTDQQIKDYFIERYGSRVVMNPPFGGFAITAWVIPPVILFSALLLFVFYIRSKLVMK